MLLEPATPIGGLVNWMLFTCAEPAETALLGAFGSGPQRWRQAPLQAYARCRTCTYQLVVMFVNTPLL
jgi:hypothetical protein